MHQLTLELAEIPVPRHGAEDGGACKEIDPATMTRCAGKLTKTIVTTSPALVGFTKTECPVCGVVRVL